MSSDNLLTLAPMEKYQAPDLPTLTEPKPELLKKIPSRWKSKALIATTAGFLGVGILTGCENLNVVDYEEQAAVPQEIQSWSGWRFHQGCNVHHGGAGGGPIYIVQLTEQEALGIIHAQLEEAGIGFNDEAPSYSVSIMHDDFGNFETVYIDDIPVPMPDTLQTSVRLFNEENKMAISIITPQHLQENFSIRGGRGPVHVTGFAEEIMSGFNQNFPHISMNLFCNPGYGIYNWDVLFSDDVDGELVTEEEMEVARQWIVDSLIHQTQGFIQQLREDGIIE